MQTQVSTLRETCLMIKVWARGNWHLVRSYNRPPMQTFNLVQVLLSRIPSKMMGLLSPKSYLQSKSSSCKTQLQDSLTLKKLHLLFMRSRKIKSQISTTFIKELHFSMASIKSGRISWWLQIEISLPITSYIWSQCSNTWPLNIRRRDLMYRRIHLLLIVLEAISWWVTFMFATCKKRVLEIHQVSITKSLLLEKTSQLSPMTYAL